MNESLHDQIMNIPCNDCDYTQYADGHRDACDAAAELAAARANERKDPKNV